MTNPHTPSEIAFRPIIPVGITPADVATEFAEDMAQIAGEPIPPPPVIPVDLDWPLVQLVRDDRDEPLVLVEAGLVPIVTTLANIAARLTDRKQTTLVAGAKRDLDAMRFGQLPGEPALTEQQCRMARAFGQGILRFLVGDACMSAFFSRPAEAGPARSLPDGRRALPVPSYWLSDAKLMRMLATFVGHKAQEDVHAPFASAARAGVSLFLLTMALWEDRRTAPNPKILSADRLESTWCLRGLGAWREANRGPDGKDHSGWGWAMSVSGFDPDAHGDE